MRKKDKWRNNVCGNSQSSTPMSLMSLMSLMNQTRYHMQSRLTLAIIQKTVDFSTGEWALLAILFTQTAAINLLIS